MLAIVTPAKYPSRKAARHRPASRQVGPDQARLVLLPRRRVVESSLSWSARYKRLARYYERLARSL